MGMRSEIVRVVGFRFGSVTFRAFYSQIGLFPSWIGHSLLSIKERSRLVMGIGFA